MIFSNKSVALEQQAPEEKEEGEKVENTVEEVKEQPEQKEQPEEDTKEDTKEEQPDGVTTTAGDGFFDDFVSNDKEEESSRGRGER